eukprot:Tbor_TRINITY_DN4900_c0_g1::TRINITY_DN4900_c0_g1_i1::g.9837::m.9837
MAVIPACLRIPSGSDEPFSFAARDLIRKQFMGYDVCVIHVNDYARIRRLQDNLEITCSLIRNGFAVCNEQDRVYNEFSEHKKDLIELQATAERRGAGVHDPCLRHTSSIKYIRMFPSRSDPFRYMIINRLKNSPMSIMRLSVEKINGGCSFSGYLIPSFQSIAVRLVGYRGIMREYVARVTFQCLSSKLLNRIVSLLIYDFDYETDEFLVELTSVQYIRFLRELEEQGLIESNIPSYEDAMKEAKEAEDNLSMERSEESIPSNRREEEVCADLLNKSATSHSKVVLGISATKGLCGGRDSTDINRVNITGGSSDNPKDSKKSQGTMVSPDSADGIEIIANLPIRKVLCTKRRYRFGTVVGVRNEMTVDVLEIFTAKGRHRPNKTYRKIRVANLGMPATITKEDTPHGTRRIILNSVALGVREHLRKLIIGKEVIFSILDQLENQDGTISCDMFLRRTDVDLGLSSKAHLSKRAGRGRNKQCLSSPRWVGYVDIRELLAQLLGKPSRYKYPEETALHLQINRGDQLTSRVVEGLSEKRVLMKSEPLDYVLPSSDSCMLEIEAVSRDLQDFENMIRRGVASNDEMLKIVGGSWGKPLDCFVQSLAGATRDKNTEWEDRGEFKSKEYILPTCDTSRSTCVNGFIGAELDEKFVSIEVVDTESWSLETFDAHVSETLIHQKVKVVVETFDASLYSSFICSVYIPDLGIQVPFKIHHACIPSYSLDSKIFNDSENELFDEIYEFLWSSLVQRDAIIQCKGYDSNGFLFGTLAVALDQVPDSWVERLGLTETARNYKNKQLVCKSELDPIMVDVFQALVTLGFCGISVSQEIEDPNVDLDYLRICLESQDLNRERRNGIWHPRCYKLSLIAGVPDDLPVKSVVSNITWNSPRPSDRTREIELLEYLGPLSFLFRYTDDQKALQEMMQDQKIVMDKQHIYPKDYVIAKLRPSEVKTIKNKKMRRAKRETKETKPENEEKQLYRARVVNRVINRTVVVELIDEGCIHVLISLRYIYLLKDDPEQKIQNFPQLNRVGHNSFVKLRVSIEDASSDSAIQEMKKCLFPALVADVFGNEITPIKRIRMSHEYSKGTEIFGCLFDNGSTVPLSLELVRNSPVVMLDTSLVYESHHFIPLIYKILEYIKS